MSEIFCGAGDAPPPLKYAPSYDLLVEALQNKVPQFQKSRAGAAIALANLGKKEVIPLLKDALNTRIFDLKYASLLALQELGDCTCYEVARHDSDILIPEKAEVFARRASA